MTGLDRPIDPQTRRIIVGWLANLARVTRHRQGRLSDEDLAAMKDERAVYAELLARDFPSGAFTLDSLHAAAQGHAFFPAYDEIRARVLEWWQAHKPASVMRLSGPDAAHLSDADALWLAFYRRRRAELLDQPGSLDLPDPHREPEAYAACGLGRLDSLLRRYAPEAWLIIAGAPRSREDLDPDALPGMAERLSNILNT